MSFSIHGQNRHWQDPVDLVLARLTRKTGHQPRPQGEGWRARCPAHDDQNPSLSVSRGADGQCLVHCHAGCTMEQIVGALDLFPGDLWPDKDPDPTGGAAPASATAGVIEAAYDYKDEEGNLLFQVVRLPGKRFRQRRPDEAGGWDWRVGDARRVPYRLPELLDGEASRPVFLVEGEKDADRLLGAGERATTVPGGAGKWRDEYGQHFRGRDVVILPDNDDPGRKHARQVAAALRGVARSVKVLELPGLPAKGDVSDWFDAGHTPGELRELAAAAPEWEGGKANEGINLVLVLRPFSEIEPEKVDFLWPPYVPRGKVTLLEGNPGLGKTWVALALAAGVSSGAGLPMAFKMNEPADVVYMTAEDGLGDTLRPRLELLGADLSRVHALEGTRVRDPKTGVEYLRPVTLQDIPILREALQRVRPALLVVDPIQGFLGADVDMHRANEVRGVLSQLGRLAEEFGCAVVAIRHLRKSAVGHPTHAGLGSIDFAAAARSIIQVAEDPEDATGRVLAHAKASTSETGKSLGFRISDRGLDWSGERDLSASDLLAPSADDERSARQEAAAWLEEQLSDGPVPAGELLKRAKRDGIAERTLNRAKKMLHVSSRQTARGWVWERSEGPGSGNLATCPEEPPSPPDSPSQGTLPNCHDGDHGKGAA